MSHRIKRLWLCLMLSALVLMTLAGCAGGKQAQPPAEASQSQEAQTSASAEQEQKPEQLLQPEQPAPPETETAPISVSSPEDIQKELYDAICAVRQPAAMDISDMAPSQHWDMDVKNLYYGLTSRYPELKYAYDVSAAAENGILTCEVSYMPYKTGDWPEQQEAVDIADLGQLLRTAEEHMGADPLPIRLTDPSLMPDEMGRVLQQAGGGYILCSLNRDGTAITYTPAMGMDMEECLSLLEQADQLAQEIVDREVNGSMTEREKAEALYTYLISHVKYDQRYYSDRSSMPYDAQTAIGALRDGLAICGGYSHALKLLFEKVGIPCFNVTGKYFSQNHMWSIARLDGEWLWFDATSDRGVSPAFGLRHFALTELDDTQYQWEQKQVELLLQMEDGQP